MAPEADRQPEMDESLARMATARNYTAWLIDRARPFLQGPVLDLGAGIGTFSEPLSADFEILALEPDRRLSRLLDERSAENPRLRVVPGGVEALGHEVDGSFGSIVCLNVLEHIDDDGSALRGCYKVLEPGGHLLLLVPAHPMLFGAVDELAGHVRRYRKRQLGEALGRAGFGIVDLRHVNPVGAVGWLVFAKLLRRRQVPLGPLASYDRVVPLLRRLERLRLPFGLSLWAVARKPIA